MRHWLVPAAKAFLLAALAAVLASVGPMPLPPDRARPAATAATAAGAPAGAPGALEGVVLVVLTRPGGNVAKLARRRGEPWRVVAPFDAPADQERAAALVERAAVVKLELLVTRDGAPLPADPLLGLAAPRLEVRLEGEGGAVLRTLRFGARNPYDGSVWAREGSGPPARVSGMTFAALDLEAEDVRERRLLPFVPSLVREVEVAGPGGARALRVTRALDVWKMEGPGAPDGARADPELVEAWLADLSSARARRHAGELAGPPPPAAHVVTVRLQSGAELAVRWDTGPLAVRSVPGEPTARVEAPPQLLADLLRRPAELSDRRVVTFARAAVSRVKVIGDDRFVLFERTAPGRWELRAPTTRAVPPGVMETLLHGLARVRAREAALAPAAPPGPRRAPPAPPRLPAPTPARAQPGLGEEPASSPATAPSDRPRLVELYDADARLLVRLELTPAAGGSYLARAGDSALPVDFAEVAALGLENLLAFGK